MQFESIFQNRPSPPMRVLGDSFMRAFSWEEGIQRFQFTEEEQAMRYVPNELPAAHADDSALMPVSARGPWAFDSPEGPHP